MAVAVVKGTGRPLSGRSPVMVAHPHRTQDTAPTLVRGGGR